MGPEFFEIGSNYSKRPNSHLKMPSAAAEVNPHTTIRLIFWSHAITKSPNFDTNMMFFIGIWNVRVVILGQVSGFFMSFPQLLIDTKNKDITTPPPRKKKFWYIMN